MKRRRRIQNRINIKKTRYFFRGFTLIELLVAISIVAIISAVSLSIFSKSQQVARDSRRRQDITAIANALELYNQVNKAYPIKSSYPTSNCASTGLTATLTTSPNVYINKIPENPTIDTSVAGNVTVTNGCYYYYSADGTTYWLLAKLETAPPANDPQLCTLTQLTNINSSWNTNTYNFCFSP